MSTLRSARASQQVFGFLLALTFALATLLTASPTAAAVQVGQLAPDFTKTDLTGATQTLSAYRGKIVVLFLLGYN